MDPATLPLPGECPVPEIGKRMRCSACGSRKAAMVTVVKRSGFPEFAPLGAHRLAAPLVEFGRRMDRVIELGEQGKSKWQIAVALGCSRKSLYQWMRTHEEFAEAMEESQFRAMAHWEDIGQAGLTMKGFNANLYSYLMKSRFREQYSDKVNVAHRGAVEVDEVEMTDLDLARRIAFIFGNALKRKQELHENGQEQVVVDGPWPPLVHKQ